MSATIQIRRDTAANWTSANPVLAQGEQGYETDTHRTKFGDGSTAWASLGYAFVNPTISSSTPNMDSTGAAGSSGQVSDAGHIHPSDTSRIPTSIGTAKGDIITYTASNTPVRMGVGTDTQGLIANSANANGLSWQYVPITVYYSGSNITSNSTSYQVSTTGFGFSLLANATYSIQANVLYSSSSTSGNIGISLNGPASPTHVSIRYEIPLSTTGSVNEYIARAYNTGTAPTAIDASGAYTLATLWATVINGSNAGALYLTFISSNSSLTMTVYPGSCMIYTRLN